MKELILYKMRHKILLFIKQNNGVSFLQIRALFKNENPDFETEQDREKIRQAEKMLSALMKESKVYLIGGKYYAK